MELKIIPILTKFSRGVPPPQKKKLGYGQPMSMSTVLYYDL